LNPFIYSLRNNELKGTLKKTLGQSKICSKWFTLLWKEFNRQESLLMPLFLLSF
jgi:hypothetical protein